VEKKRLAQKIQKSPLRTCLKAIHEATRRYYYWLSAEKSVPGSLSYLIGISEEELVEIFKICGFYNNKRSAFLLTGFQAWAEVTIIRRY
jgi:hypothetical protein